MSPEELENLKKFVEETGLPMPDLEAIDQFDKIRASLMQAITDVITVNLIEMGIPLDSQKADTSLAAAQLGSSHTMLWITQHLPDQAVPIVMAMLAAAS